MLGMTPRRTQLTLIGLASLVAAGLGPAWAAGAPATHLAANTGAAESCAKTLPSESRLIFDATMRNMKGLDTIREVVEEQTRALVSAGKIGMLKARSAAETAGNCLKLLAS